MNKLTILLLVVLFDISLSVHMQSAPNPAFNNWVNSGQNQNPAFSNWLNGSNVRPTTPGTPPGNNAFTNWVNKPGTPTQGTKRFPKASRL